MPASLDSNSTEVVTYAGAELGGESVDVLGVDPSTFARGAFWDRSFSNQSIDTLMSDLERHPDAQGSPAILAGGGSGLGSSPLRLPTYGGFITPANLDIVAERPALNFPARAPCPRSS